MKKLNANDMVIKIKKIKNLNHYLQYSEYIKKDSSDTIKNISDKEMYEVYKEHIERIKSKNTKSGRPPQMAHSMIFSIPSLVSEKVKNMSIEEKKELINIFLDSIYKDLQGMYKNIDIDFIKNNTQIEFHNDTDNPHYHILMPKFSFFKRNLMEKMTNKKEYQAIDYGKRFISSNARKRMINTFKRMNSEIILTNQQFNEEIKNARSEKIKKRNEDIKNGIDLKKDRKFEIIKQELQKEIKKLERIVEDLEDRQKNGEYLTPNNKNRLDSARKVSNRAQKQLNNNNTNRAKKTIESFNM